MIAVIMVCDRCEALGHPGIARREMELKYGWICTGLYDYCGPCSQKVIKKKSVTFP